MTIRNTQKKGFTISTQKAEIVLGEQVEVNRKETEKDPYVIASPGEFDVEEVTVFCNYIGQTDDQTHIAYTIQAENMTIGYLPNPPKSITDTAVTEFEQIEILLIPGDRADVAEQIAAPVIIPINKVEELCKELSTDIPEKASTFTIKSSSELPEETEIVNLG